MNKEFSKDLKYTLYNDAGKCFWVYWKNEPSHDKKINEHLTLRKSRLSGELIGIVINGFRDLMEDDIVKIKWENKDHFKDPINKYLTLYVANDTFEIIGVEINHVKELMEE